MSLCELCGDETDGRYLCERHAVGIAKSLGDLPVLYSEVAECLVPRRYGWGEIVATKGAAGPCSPINEDVLDTVNWGRAAEVVRSWRVDVQRVRWPQHSAPAPAGLAADCRWLGMEFEWIVAEYPACGDLAREVRELENQARSVVGDPAPRPQRLGLCVAVTDGEGTVCGAVLTRLPGGPVRCRWCGCEYKGETDLLLLRHYQPKEPATPGVPDAAEARPSRV